MRALVVASVAAALALGFARGGGVGTATGLCATRSFQVVFDPRGRVTVTGGGRILGSASLAARRLGCRLVTASKRIVTPRDLSALRTEASFGCVAPAAIRIRVNPIRNEAGKAVGSTLAVGTGDPLRLVVSAVLEPGASRVYRARSACKPGAAY